MPALMIQGVSSWAGKSLVTTALVRLLARRGVRVAPFKGQNMSNNARVVAGGEIGVAQYLQALAAGIEPDTRMNPVLVKPEGERRSQVVIDGRPDLALSELPWRERGPALWPPIERALRSLLDEYELVVIEGAGSPAEINLRSTDLANMRVAHAAGASVLLVADIDRGGAFAHLYGTWALLDEPDRATIRAFVLNKFRGDPSLLPPAPAELERLTGVPVAGVLPWLEHGLPDEDGAAQRTGQGPKVAVVRYPTASNLDELRAAEQVADVRFVSSPGELEDAELVVLPGSKHVRGDLDWLRRTGLAEAVERKAAAGTRMLGICGGLQMLGERLDEAPGLGLLPVRTEYAAEKLTRKVNVCFGDMPAPWTELSGAELDGYEIRHGDTRGAGDGLVFVHGNVLGVSFHGLLESAAGCNALLGAVPAEPLETVFDGLADAVETHLDLEHIA
jgi:adenosylcobyric acid synthase